MRKINNNYLGTFYIEELELAYDKLGCYDEEYDKALEHAKEMEEFYSNLMRKLKEVL